MNKRKIARAIAMTLTASMFLGGCSLPGKEAEKEKRTTKKTESKKEDKEEQKNDKKKEKQNDRKNKSVTNKNVSYSLKKKTTFKNKSYVSLGNALYKQDRDAGEITFVNNKGEECGTYNNAEEVLNGYYEVSATEDKMAAKEINRCGLIDEEGRELIPCEAAYMRALDEDGASDRGSSKRFLLVCYADAIVDNEDEALFFITDTWLINPSETDTLCSGHGKIYDLEKEQFVDSVEITKDNMNSLKVTGDYISLEEGEKTKFYNADGELVSETEENVMDIGKEHYVIYSDHQYILCDINGKAVFKTDKRIKIIPGDELYLAAYEDSKAKILDSHGNTVNEQSYNDVNRTLNGRFAVCNKDNEYAVVEKDGTECMPYSKGFITTTPNGFFVRYKEENGYDILDAEGNLYENIESNEVGGTCVIKKEQGDTDVVYCYAEKDYTEEVQYCNATIWQGLVAVKKKDSKWGLYDAITGKLLLDYKYDGISTIGTCIYAVQNNKYTVYEVVEN